jgi:hypothetical protein
MLGQQPGKLHLRRGKVFVAAYFVERVNQRLVGFHRVLFEVGQQLAHVVFWKVSARPHGAREVGLAQRAPRHEANAQLLAGWQHVRLRLARSVTRGHTRVRTENKREFLLLLLRDPYF